MLAEAVMRIFRYKGGLYRFRHSIKKARERGIEMRSGSEALSSLC